MHPKLHNFRGKRARPFGRKATARKPRPSRASRTAARARRGRR